MEERVHVDASTNFCSRSVAATGWRHLRHRPIDANQLCYFILLPQPVDATGRRQLRPRPVDCAILFSLLNLWLLLAGGISAIARLNLFIFAELLHDYYCLNYSVQFASVSC